MIDLSLYRLVIILVMLSIVQGCSAIKTFPSTVRAGETTAIATGWKQSFSKENTTVTITPSIGSPIIILPGDPAIRAVVNLYPDPASNIIVSGETGYDVSPFASTYATQLTQNFTEGDKDWYQTTIFIDLPESLPLGATSITISNLQGESYSTTVDIIASGGGPDAFEAELNGPLSSNQLKSLERNNYYIINFNSAIIPHAIQIDLNHDADIDNGGNGKAYVVNPRGDIKNILWRDDGQNLRVFLLPTWSKPFDSIKDFKFYIAGSVTGLLVNNVMAVDSSGNQILGVTVTIEQY